MENLFFKDDGFFDLDFDNLTDDERAELAKKVQAAQQDRRYSNEAWREPAYVAAIDLAWKKLYPGKRSGV